MTTATVKTDGWHHSIVCEGHSADTACCNYITGIMYAFGGYVKTMEGNNECAAVVDELEIDEKRPSFHIRCSGDERIEAAFLAAYIGLKQLEATRPDAITVKAEGI